MLHRLVEVFAFLGFVVYLRAFAYGPLLAAAAITGSLLVSYTRARGESVGVLCKEGLMQRAERLVLSFAACLLDPPPAAALGLPPGAVGLRPLALGPHPRRHLRHRRPPHGVDRLQAPRPLAPANQ